MYNDTAAWHSPPADIDLPYNQLHLWRAQLDADGYNDHLLWDYLSKSEQERASRFIFPTHRLRFIRSHGIARVILSRYCGEPASALQIVNTAHGKPFLEKCEKRGIQFNLSHSEDLMVIGIAPGREIGVDIEIYSRKADWRQIAKGYFSSREVDMIERQETEKAQITAFFQLWTLKEAYMKACGKGMAVPLRRVELEFRRGKEPIFIDLPGGDDEIRQWQVMRFLPIPGGSGSIVIEKKDFITNLQKFDF